MRATRVDNVGGFKSGEVALYSSGPRKPLRLVNILEEVRVVDVSAVGATLDMFSWFAMGQGQRIC